MVQIKMGHLGYLCNYAVPVKTHIFSFFICNPLMSAILFTYSSQGDTANRAGKKTTAPVDIQQVLVHIGEIFAE